ncbi:MAG: hypothetical protein N4A48_08715 [Tepidibacter sp.]|nr:hypothetical protein [Tepidibacter sp.]MCT4508828.1 hypothetical protein [Tepidibacter sp.]
MNKSEEILAEEFVTFILDKVTKFDFDKVFKVGYRYILEYRILYGEYYHK